MLELCELLCLTSSLRRNALSFADNLVKMTRERRVQEVVDALLNAWPDAANMPCSRSHRLPLHLAAQANSSFGVNLNILRNNTVFPVMLASPRYKNYRFGDSKLPAPWNFPPLRPCRLRKFEIRAAHLNWTQKNIYIAAFTNLLDTENVWGNTGGMSRRYWSFEEKTYPAAVEGIDRSTVIKRLRRLFKREKIVLRRVTHTSQRINTDGVMKADFVDMVNEEILKAGYELDCVVNIDETNINFDMVTASTFERASTKTVSMKETSALRCTVLLGVSLAGQKLKPFVIFKGRRNGKIDRELKSFPSDCIYAVQEKAWIDKDTFNDWTNEVWALHVNGRPSYLLVPGAFAEQLCASIARARY